MTAASASKDPVRRLPRRIRLGALAVTGSLAALAAALWAWADLPAAALPPGAKIDHLVVEKAAHRLRAYGEGRLLKTYTVSIGPQPGPKRREGDRRTPEGAYTIDWHNGSSSFHLSLHVSYPSPADQRRAQEAGYSPGGDIMIHGLPNAGSGASTGCTIGPQAASHSRTRRSRRSSAPRRTARPSRSGPEVRLRRRTAVRGGKTARRSWPMCAPSAPLTRRSAALQAPPV
jgi:hypothetical protein